jgi:hypothetical protein
MGAGAGRGRDVETMLDGAGTGPGLYPDLQGTYSIAEVVTRAGYSWHIDDLARLMADVSSRTPLKVRLSGKSVVLGRDSLKSLPVIVFTGHRTFDLTEAERQALRNYVAGGGTIWGDDSGTEFDDSFREQMAKTFGAEPRDIPIEDAVYRAFYIQTDVPHGDSRSHRLFQGIMAPDGDRYGVIITCNRYFAAMDGPPNVTVDTQRKSLEVGTNIFFYAVKHYQSMVGEH